MPRRILPFLLAVAVLPIVLAACGGSGGGSGSTASASTSSNAASGGGTTIKTAQNSGLGTYLVDQQGRAVYLFEKDTGRMSTCSGACATVWPPVTTSGDPTGTGGVKTSQLSTVARSDGKQQVLYHGHPLYYYEPDSSGSVTGQGLDDFGAEWYVLAPSGDKIEKAAS